MASLDVASAIGSRPLTLSYDTDTSAMPPHVVLAHQKYAMTLASDRELQCIAAPKTELPRVLLHSCCAPCSGAMIHEMSRLSLCITVFFYNPNIHPRREYDIRKAENKRFAEKLGIPFVDADYDSSEWFRRASGMEFDAERGTRCTMCFDMRMERTAQYAKDHGYNVIATTNATSRWKDAKQVDESGARSAAKHEGIEYWKADWQTDRMTLLKYQISAGERFYKQEYCGCAYSLRDSNRWREANGIGKIRIGGEQAGLGERYFTDPEVDAAEESQEVVDEFFASANEIASAEDKESRDKLWDLYRERKKNQQVDQQSGDVGTSTLLDINNW